MCERSEAPLFWVRRGTKRRWKPFNSWATHRVAQPETVNIQQNECEGRDRVPPWTSEGWLACPRRGRTLAWTGEAGRCMGNQAWFVLTAAVFTLSWTEVVAVQGGEMVGMERVFVQAKAGKLPLLATENCTASLQFAAPASEISVAAAVAAALFVCLFFPCQKCCVFFRSR